MYPISYCVAVHIGWLERTCAHNNAIECFPSNKSKIYTPFVTATSIVANLGDILEAWTNFKRVQRSPPYLIYRYYDLRDRRVISDPKQWTKKLHHPHLLVWFGYMLTAVANTAAHVYSGTEMS